MLLLLLFYFVLAAESVQWRQYSMGGLAFCGVITAWVIYFESNHEHHHYPERAYKKVISSAAARFTFPVSRRSESVDLCVTVALSMWIIYYEMHFSPPYSFGTSMLWGFSDAHQALPVAYGLRALRQPVLQGLLRRQGR